MMDKDAAIQKIIRLALTLDATLDECKLNFYATKLVLDVLDYCHRKDFPEAVCYTCAGVLSQAFASSTSGATTGSAPLKKLVENDVTYEWAVSEVDSSTALDDQIFDAIKPRLSLYRKVVGL